MVQDSSKPDHVEGENRKAAAAGALSPKHLHAGDKSAPSQEEVQTSENAAKEKTPEVPVTQKDAVQKTVTVSEETGEEEMEQVRMNEPTESCEEEKKLAEEQTDGEQVEKESVSKVLVEESAGPVEITEPQNILPEEAVPERDEACTDDTRKTKDLVEMEPETEKKKVDMLQEEVGEEANVRVPAEEEKKEEVDEKKLQEDTEEDQPKTEVDPKESIQVENKTVCVTSTDVKDISVETKKKVNERETSMDVPPAIIINGEKDEVDHVSQKTPETSHETSASREAATEDEVDQNRVVAIKPDIEKDSDSGSSSAADTNSIDMNLSISSFLSRSKEGSISVQVSMS